MKTIAVRSVLCACMLLVSAPALAAGPAAGSAQPEAAASAPVYGADLQVLARYFNDPVQISTSTTTWRQAAYTLVTLSGDPQCVEVEFSDETTVSNQTSGYLYEPNSIQYRAMIGSSLFAFGGLPYTHVDRNWFEDYSTTWWRCGLPPGTYSITVWFKAVGPGDVALVRNRNMIVHYAH